METQPVIKIDKLQKVYGKNAVLKDISEEVKSGEVICVIGPSGAGKSTFLRCLNLLETPTSGSVLFEGTDLTTLDEKHVNQLREKMGMVFQSFNLFPNMTVIENLKLAPKKVKNVSDEEATKSAKELLEKVGMSDKADAYPVSLSGGQQQRVAIARALAMNPEVMLFDEPTSALDPEMVGEVLELIKKVADTGKTMIIVSHEMNFVKKIANRILFLDEGKIMFDGKTKDFFNSDNERIKEFLSKINK